jgi:hypothetical protein
LRWEGALNSWSSVTNSALYMGNGWGAHVTKSANILFKNNVVFNFIVMGVVVDMSKNVTFDGNLISSIKPRMVLVADMFMDPMCGAAICAYVPNSKCTNVNFINNIVAGANMIGIAVPGRNCNDKTDKHLSNNVVHSVEGVGVAIFPVPGSEEHKVCYEAADLAAYKIRDAGIFSYYETKKVQFVNVTSIDNSFGVVSNVG